MKLRLDGRFLMQRKMKRSTARERPGNDTLTEPSKRTLLVGVKTVGRGFGPLACVFIFPPPAVHVGWLATPLMLRYIGNGDIPVQGYWSTTSGEPHGILNAFAVIIYISRGSMMHNHDPHSNSQLLV